MADVTRERAQLILVSGLLIAVTMLVLVLLLNTAIYTENVATRGIDSDVGPAADVQEILDREVASMLNSQSGTVDTQNGVNETTGSDLAMLFSTEADLALERGHLLTIDEEIRYGALINQTVEDESDAPVTDVEYIRSFELTLDTSTLEDESVEIAEGDWALTAEISEDNVTLSQSEDDTCVIDNIASELTINVTDECGGDIFDEQQVPHNVSSPFETTLLGNESIGYELVVGGTDLTVDVSAEWYADGLNFAINYTSNELHYETSRSVQTEVVP